MRILAGWEAPPEMRGASVALGNFDGVHRGHLHLLEAAHMARPDLKRAVLCFEPHPRAFFRPQDPPFRIASAGERRDALAAAGVELLFEIPFTEAFSTLSAAAFVEEVLHRGVGAGHLACGEDFAFGHRRGGDAAFLAGRAAGLGIGVSVIPPLLDGGAPISSTRIRRLLQDGYPERAAAALGRPWTLTGRVAHGDRRGRTIGFPTANVPLSGHLEPARGVYAVTVTVDGESHAGVANVGVRPTVGGRESRIEAHLFDWDGDLYGREVAVTLRRFLRAERRFEDLAALRAQIALDAEAARDVSETGS